MGKKSRARQHQRFDADRMRAWEDLEREKSIWRIKIANFMNEAGIEQWLALKSVQDAVAMGNMLNFLGVPTNEALRIASYSRALAWDSPEIGGYSPRHPKDRREWYDGIRMTFWEIEERHKLLDRIAIANEINRAGIDTRLAVEAITNPTKMTEMLKSLGMPEDKARKIALDTRALEWNSPEIGGYTPKNAFGKERGGLNRFLNGAVSMPLEAVKKALREAGRPIIQHQVKESEKQLQGILKEIQLLEDKAFNELSSKKANEHNKIDIARQDGFQKKRETTEKFLLEKKLLLDVEKNKQLALDNYKQKTLSNSELMRVALYACMQGEITVVEALLKRNRALKFSFLKLNPLHIAAQYNHISIIKLLCRHGVDVLKRNDHGQTALDIAEENGHIEAEITLKNSIFQSELLSIAVHEQNITKIEEALQNGADVNSSNLFNFFNGYNIVQLAIFNKFNFEVIKKLINAGTDLHHKDNELKKDALQLAENHPDPNVKTLIEETLKKEEAEATNEEPLVEQMVSENIAAMNFLNKIDTASKNLLNAAETGYLPGIEESLAKGADINEVNAEGFNALQLAIFHRRNLDVIKKIIKSGISLDYQGNRQNKTALQLAKEVGLADSIEYLNEQLSEKRTTLITDAVSHFKQSYQRHLDKAQHFLDRWPTDNEKCQAILAYYRLLSQQNPYAIYACPAILLIGETLTEAAKMPSEALSATPKADLLKKVQTLFKRTFAAHQTLTEVGVEHWEILNTEPEYRDTDWSHIIGSITLENQAKILASSRSLKVNDEEIVKEIGTQYATLFSSGTKSYLNTVAIQVLGLNFGDMTWVDPVSQWIVETRQGSNFLFREYLKNTFKQQLQSVAKVAKEVEDAELISSPRKTQLKESISHWNAFHCTLTEKLRQVETEVTKELQELAAWLAAKQKEYDDYLIKSDNYLHSTHLKDEEIEFHFKNEAIKINRFFEKLRIEKQRDHEDSIEKLRANVSVKLAGILVAACIAPQLAPELAQGIGVGLELSKAAIATLEAVIQGALTGAISSAFSGGNILKETLISAGLGWFGHKINIALEIDSASKVLGSKDLLATTITQTASSIIQGGHVGKDFLISIIEGGLSLGSSRKPTAFLDILKSKIQKTIATATAKTVIQGGNFAENIASAGVANTLQTIGEQTGEAAFQQQREADDFMLYDSCRLGRSLQEETMYALSKSSSDTFMQVQKIKSNLVPPDPNKKFLNYVYQIGIRIEKGRDAIVDMLKHPVETITNTAITIFDGWNAISDITLGISTEQSRKRNEMRGHATVNAIEEFKLADGAVKVGMLAEITTVSILGSLFGSSARSIMSKSTSIVTTNASTILEKMNLAVKTPYGYAYQRITPAALRARSNIKNDAMLYRAGTTLGQKPSAASEAQFWALKNPLYSTYAKEHGIPPKNANFCFAIGGQLKPGAKVITRKAPGVGVNGGGVLEAVTSENAVSLRFYNAMECNPQIMGRDSFIKKISSQVIHKASSSIFFETSAAIEEHKRIKSASVYTVNQSFTVTFFRPKSDIIYWELPRIRTRNYPGENTPY